MIEEEFDYDCGTKCRQNNILRKNKDLIKQVRNGEIKSDLEAFAQLTEYASFLTGDCVECFIDDLGAVLTGHSNRHPARDELRAQLGLVERNSPYINRFLQPDTLIPGVDSPQSWNRFSYVNNNPVRFSDPTGHYCVGDDADCVDGGGGTGPVQSDNNNGSSGGSCNAICQLSNDIDNVVIPVVDSLYDIVGSNSDDGCNSWLLWNGSNFCHHTTYTSQPICVPVSLCSSDDDWGYATRFQYPGQWPGNPVVGGGQERHVMGGDLIPWKWLQNKGAITVEIDGNKIINRTVPTHIFHQGDITRTISNGWVTTEGHGTNSSFAVAVFNQYGGPVAFESWDFLMTSFSTLDKLSDGALLNIVNAIP